jgi:cell division protease FtsH
MVNEAALNAARYNRKSVLMVDFEQAKDKVLMGAERKSMLLTDEEKRVTAYHEAGHALVAALRLHADPLHKVTIIPRGMALGVTMQLPEDDKHTVTKDYLETQLAILMGGRIAEEIFLKQMTTGAGNDIERATDLARKMVCEYGMSRLGPLTFGKKEEQIFLGREIAQHRDFSEETARQIDGEVRSLVDEAYKASWEILNTNQPVMHRLAMALLERETLDAIEIACADRRQGTAADGRVLYQNDALSYREQYQSPQDLTGFIREDPAAVNRLARDFAQALVGDMLESFR